jgi:hypothetical protein
MSDSNLEKMMQDWRRQLGAAGVSSETVRELESHLRHSVDHLMDTGLNGEKAFAQAVAQMGTPPALALEFGKMNQVPGWVKGLMAGFALADAALVIFMLLHFHTRGGGWVYLIHFTALSAGYMVWLSAGFAGVCLTLLKWLNQRIIIPPGPLHWAMKMGALMTCIGVAFGGLWSLMGQFNPSLVMHWANYNRWAAFASCACLAAQIAALALLPARANGQRDVPLAAMASSAVLAGCWFGPFLLAPNVHAAQLSVFWLTLTLVPNLFGALIWSRRGYGGPRRATR